MPGVFNGLIASVQSLPITTRRSAEHYSTHCRARTAFTIGAGVSSLIAVITNQN
jgi:hypothetical protein